MGLWSKVLTNLGEKLTQKGFQSNYGQQIGKISKSGLMCFKKAKGNKVTYTTLDALTEDVVRTKQVITQSKDKLSTLKDFYTYDAKGNLLEHATMHRSQQGFGLANNNAFSAKIVNFREEFNKFGQPISYNYTEITPSLNAPKATIAKNNNGNLSQTYLNTKNNTMWTITCIN